MIVTCEECQSKFKIPEEKIPKGKVFLQTCPKCDNKSLPFGPTVFEITNEWVLESTELPEETKS